ncbi:MAG: hypothetical protein JNN17_18510 [Verrucomicrobiaceae bacterium]|nr:hypothetical protein [Verrucomicrobiaceae bacterium]
MADEPEGFHGIRSHRKPLPIHTRSSEGGEGFEDFLEGGGFGGGEVFGEVGGGDGGSGGVERGFDGADAVGEGFGPRLLRGLLDGGCLDLALTAFLRLQRQLVLLFALRSLPSALVVGAQPVDDTAFFFVGALGVEVDEAFEDFGVG